MVCNHLTTLHRLIWYPDSFSMLEQEVANTKKLATGIFFPFLSHYSHILRTHAHIFTEVSTLS